MGNVRLCWILHGQFRCVAIIGVAGALIALGAMVGFFGGYGYFISYRD